MKHSTFVLIAAVALLAPPNTERVRERVQRLRDGDTDAWRRIPWSASLLDAAKAAAEEGRPMFVFAHDGNIDTGRC